jgi:2-polyprenyl-3-methyl-5-hydroxy-6-metoxy-1,4-benzoquinol methylase
LFEGNRARVVFRRQSIKDYAAANPASVDLLIISDIMHHIPQSMHREIFALAKITLKPEGFLIFKDWERNSALIHLICYFAERYVTGDRVAYRTADEFRELIKDVFGAASIRDEVRIGPWKNNFVFLVQSG